MDWQPFVSLLCTRSHMKNEWCQTLNSLLLFFCSSPSGSRMSKRKRDVSVSTMNLNDLFGDSVQNSAIYFKLLLWGCLAFKFYTNLWLLTLWPVAGFLLLLKMINRYFSLSDWAIAKVGWFVFFFFFFFLLLLFSFKFMWYCTPSVVVL